MKRDWSVRCAVPADFDRWMSFVKTVQREFHGINLTEDMRFRDAMMKNIGRSTAVYVADEKTADIIGAMTYSPRSLHIGWLAVHPDHRRKGIGTALVRHMLSVLPDRTPVKVRTFLDTDPQGKAAHGFYESLGFRPGEIEDDAEHLNAGHPFQVFLRDADGG